MNVNAIKQVKLTHHKKYFLPFSPYQIFLFLFDVFLCIISFCILFFRYWPQKVNVDFFSIVILIIPIISFFPMYKLYSYHIIFRKSSHVKSLFKSFSWSMLSFFVIYFLYDWPYLFYEHNLKNGIFILIAAFLIAILGRLFADYFTKCLVAIGIAFVTVGLFGLTFGDERPFFTSHILETNIAILIALSFLVIGRSFIVHTIYNNWLRRFFRKQMIIVGYNKIADKILEHIIKYNAPFWVNGLVELYKKEEVMESVCSKSFLNNKKKLGTVKDLPEIVKRNAIQEIIITDQSIKQKTLISLLDFSVSNGIVAWFPPSMLPIIPMKLNIDDFCGLPMIRMCVQRNPSFFRILKRCTDLIFSLILIVILTPLFGIIAIAIKLDSKGPVFYKAEMVGEDGKRFKMLKFRSMKVDADTSIHKNFVSKFIKGEIDRKKKSVLKITNDPRVTRVGKIIRRLSLDELPQLFNVIKGDMSLVGPRPCLPYEYELYKDWHRKRNSVKPGITGLWQIAGRSEVSFEEMILLDLYYIYNRNLLLDISILFETIFVVLGMKGAY